MKVGMQNDTLNELHSNTIPTLDSESFIPTSEIDQPLPQRPKRTKGKRELSHLDESSIISSEQGRSKRHRVDKKYSK